MSEDSKRIGVVGLGKLGACVAACLASRGFDVIGIDAEPGKVEAIQNGRAPVDEPGLQQKILQMQCGKDFGLGYNPEFIALGNVVRGLLEPDFVLLGESDSQTGERLEQIYRRFCTNNAPIERMSCANAELCKISVNCAV